MGRGVPGEARGTAGPRTPPDCGRRQRTARGLRRGRDAPDGARLNERTAWGLALTGRTHGCDAVQPPHRPMRVAAGSTVLPSERTSQGAAQDRPGRVARVSPSHSPCGGAGRERRDPLWGATPRHRVCPNGRRCPRRLHAHRQPAGPCAHGARGRNRCDDAVRLLASRVGAPHSQASQGEARAPRLGASPGAAGTRCGSVGGGPAHHDRPPRHLGRRGATPAGAVRPVGRGPGGPAARSPPSRRRRGRRPGAAPPVRRPAGAAHGHAAPVLRPVGGRPGAPGGGAARLPTAGGARCRLRAWPWAPPPAGEPSLASWRLPALAYDAAAGHPAAARARRPRAGAGRAPGRRPPLLDRGHALRPRAGAPAAVLPHPGAGGRALPGPLAAPARRGRRPGAPGGAGGGDAGRLPRPLLDAGRSGARAAPPAARLRRVAGGRGGPLGGTRRARQRPGARCRSRSLAAAWWAALFGWALVEAPPERLRAFQDSCGPGRSGGASTWPRRSGSASASPRRRPTEPGDQEWRLEYLLQATDDPSLLVPAGEVWRQRGATARFLDRRLDHPQERLLAGLGRAARLFPPMEAEPAPGAPGSLRPLDRRRRTGSCARRRCCSKPAASACSCPGLESQLAPAPAPQGGAPRSGRHPQRGRRGRPSAGSRWSPSTGRWRWATSR